MYSIKIQAQVLDVAEPSLWSVQARDTHYQCKYNNIKVPLLIISEVIVGTVESQWPVLLLEILDFQMATLICVSYTLLDLSTTDIPVVFVLIHIQFLNVCLYMAYNNGNHQ